MASRFIERVRVGGFVLDEYEKFALHYWCNENFKNGLLGNYLAYYPFVGGRGTAQSIINFGYNLICTDSTAAYLYDLSPFGVSASMCTINGYQGNGGTFWNTSIIPSSDMTINNNHMSFYSRSQISSSSGNVQDMGVRDNDTTIAMSLYASSNTVSLPLVRFESNQTNQTIVNTTSTMGYFSGSRTTSTQMIATYNNSTSTIATGTNSGSMPTNPIYLGACNRLATPNYHTTRQYCMFSVGSSFNLAQETTRYIIEQNTQKYLKRAV